MKKSTKKAFQLKDLQRYIAKKAIERGFADETVPQKFMLLIEEIGEFAKAARKSVGIKTGKHSADYNPEHEVADVLIHILGICNGMGIDLEKAFWDKEAINNKRVWK